MTSPKTRPTPEEARRAIYIDFEGNKGQPPVLLGVLYATNRRAKPCDRLVLEHHVIDNELWPLHDAVAPPYDGIVETYTPAASTLECALASIVRRAEKQDRLIVSWSEHEVKKLNAAVDDDDLLDAFQRRFRNARAIATRWLRETDPERMPQRQRWGGANALGRYLDIIAYDVPPAFGAGRTGANLSALRTAMTSHRSRLTDLQRTGWWEVLGHNMHDCVGTRAVLMCAAGAELDVIGG